MSQYAESSAVLAWLLDEDSGTVVREYLAGEPVIVASDLTLIECDRVLQRAATAGELSEADAADRRACLASVASHWTLMRMGLEVVERVRQPFPGTPIRTLDAIHLASLLVARSSLAGLALLSLDGRVRGAAARLGVKVHPP